jgi:fermentation-respiration switch protein FrsA (DUF1100 family)
MMRVTVRSVARTVLRVAVLLATLAFVIVLFEKRLIYYPYRVLDATPGQLGLAHEELDLRAADGVRIHGWFLPVPESRFTVLLCHGNAGNISHRLDRVLLMRAHLRTDVLLFDYRGYGGSEGSPDEEGTYRDARAAYAWLRRKGVPPERVVLFGESLGAAVAVQLALDQPARALVLESAFASVPAMAREVFPFLPLAPFVRNRYDTLAKAPRLRLPLLVLHGERDRTVPLSQGRKVFDAAPGPKRFFLIAGADHNDSYVTGGEGYWRAWREFLNSLRPESANGPAGGADELPPR